MVRAGETLHGVPNQDPLYAAGCETRLNSKEEIAFRRIRRDVISITLK
jgi:hypothetical protein